MLGSLIGGIVYEERACSKYCHESESKIAATNMYCCATDGCNASNTPIISRVILVFMSLLLYAV